MLLHQLSEEIKTIHTAAETRLAVIVSHPIQYYVPLYQRLARRADVDIKVFFTWHGGERAVLDHGFKREVAWDVNLTDGYEYEVVPNVARVPGTHHFRGLQNPSLTARVLAWQPAAVHLTGYAFDSHWRTLRALSRAKIPVLFRGDSHLLDGASGVKWLGKRALLAWIYRWPAAFLYVGQANRAYYERFGVPEAKLHYCPHSIEVSRFAEPAAQWEAEAAAWRAELGITAAQRVLLFAGKFEDKKQPLALMQAFLQAEARDWVLVMVGDGVLGQGVQTLAQAHPTRFRVLPFQNQSRMPLVYRLGDMLVLPSTYGETWGLAVNEALACGRPVLVSDRVGCAADVVRAGQTGEVFRAGDWEDFRRQFARCAQWSASLSPATLTRAAQEFDIAATERHLMSALAAVVATKGKLS